MLAILESLIITLDGQSVVIDQVQQPREEPIMVVLTVKVPQHVTIKIGKLDEDMASIGDDISGCGLAARDAGCQGPFVGLTE
jgi:hypothetical protein